jgi:hypothetical protein
LSPSIFIGVQAESIGPVQFVAPNFVATLPDDFASSNALSAFDDFKEILNGEFISPLFFPSLFFC